MKRKLGRHAWFQLIGMAGAMLVLFSLTWLLESAVERTELVRGAGSDTMAPLFGRWGEAYLQGREGKKILYSPVGSERGIRTFLYEGIEFTASSRALSSLEKAIASERGFTPVEFIVAWDAIAIVVNPENPVEALTLNQLRQIFTGEITTWDVVGGAKEAIHCFARGEESGTRRFFAERILNGGRYDLASHIVDGNAKIVRFVSQVRGGIGFVGLAHAREAKETVKVLALAPHEGAPAVMPVAKAISAGAYALARPLRIYARGEPQGALKGFIDFCLSDEGQRMVAEAGDLPVALHDL